MEYKDMMKFVESEYMIIRYTPCEICGGKYIVQRQEIEFIEDHPMTVSVCKCEKCGHKKEFFFRPAFTVLDVNEKNTDVN